MSQAEADQKNHHTGPEKSEPQIIDFTHKCVPVELSDCVSSLPTRTFEPANNPYGCDKCNDSGLLTLGCPHFLLEKIEALQARVLELEKFLDLP
jgi:hypothetical protein